MRYDAGYFDRLLGRTGRLTQKAQKEAERNMVLQKQKFAAGELVRVSSAESPFHNWEGMVITAFDKDGVLYYKVRLPETGFLQALTFAQTQIEKVLR